MYCKAIHHQFAVNQLINFTKGLQGLQNKWRSTSSFRAGFGLLYSPAMRELLNHSLMCFHIVHDRRDSPQVWIELAIFFSRIASDVVGFHLRQPPTGSGLKMRLDVSVAQRTQLFTTVEKDLFSPSMALSQQEQRQLIHSIDHSIFGNSVQCATQPRCGGVEIRDVQQIHWLLVGQNHSRPPRHAWRPHSALQHLALAATEPGIARVGVEGVHGPVVTHPDYQGVLCNLFLFQSVQEPCNI
mmetsp:Transcript_66466/g.134934  ORF Transcript_66466/g.134934 Transcript_66466/m.134934 type:complete len:241 (+) Transcript_66466:124-846(+)